MLRKLLVLTWISVGSIAAANAQDAPKDKSETRVQGMVMTPFERSYLGVQMQEINRENYTRFGLSSVRGVGVEKVLENSPAATGGLQNNDVIIRFDGETVESIAKLSRLISEVAPDHQAKITVLRGGSEIELNVTMGKRDFAPFRNSVRIEGLGNFPQMQRLPATPLPPMSPLPPSAQTDGNVFIWRGGASRQIGIGVTELTKQLSDYFGIAGGAGVLISNARDDSPAAKAGLKAGDIIIEADGKQVKGQTDLIRAINDKKDGDVTLTIIRDRNRQTVRVTPEASKNGFQPFDNFIESAPPAQFNFQTPPTTPVAPLPATVVRTAPRIL